MSARPDQSPSAAGRRVRGRRARWSLLALVMGLAPVWVVALAVAEPPSGDAAVAEEDWWSRSTVRRFGPYRVKTDVEDAVADRIGRHLVTMHRAYRERLASIPPRGDERFDVMVFRDRGDYLRVLGRQFEVDARGTGGVFFVGARGSALAVWIEDLPWRRIEHVLQHEGFHQFAHSRFGRNLPIWVNEGLAEFFGEARIVDGELVIGQSSPRTVEAVRRLVEADRHLPLEVMLTLDHQSWGAAIRAGAAAAQYRQAWSMVHFLVYAEGGRFQGAFESYLHRLARGVEPLAAFEAAFGTTDVTNFERRWVDYALEARPTAFAAALERLELFAEGLLELAGEGVHPRTLAELREALVARDFALEASVHGPSSTLAASDPSVWTLPAGEHTPDPPTLELEVIDPERVPRARRMLEAARPTPPTIRTRGLEPRDLEIRWDRDRRTHAFTYRIVRR